jgi:hypothetical protein
MQYLLKRKITIENNLSASDENTSFYETNNGKDLESSKYTYPVSPSTLFTLIHL